MSGLIGPRSNNLNRVFLLEGVRTQKKVAYSNMILLQEAKGAIILVF